MKARAEEVLASGSTRHGEWHHAACWSAPFQPCPEECREAQDELERQGVLPTSNTEGRRLAPQAYGLPL